MRKDDIPSQSLEVDLFRFQHISDSVCFVDKMMAFYYFDSSYIQNVNEIILQPKSLTNLRVALPWYADIKHHNWLKQSWDLEPVWPDWAIYWTLGNFSKPVATISLRKSRTFLGNSCKGVKIFNFSSEIILGNFYRHLAKFDWPHWLLDIVTS